LVAINLSEMATLGFKRYWFNNREYRSR